MIVQLFALLILVERCLANDSGCLNLGGHCQEDSLSCSGSYHSGLCTGHASRRCCVPSSLQSSSDSCASLRGLCQDDSQHCRGSYVSGLCSGGSHNRCCTSYSHLQVHDTGDCSAIKIISRDSWGARRPKTTSYLTNPVANFVIHHTESPSCTSEAECVSRMKGFQEYHMNHNGWSDIGYSFLVGEDGNVYEGRGWNRIGAHTYGYNSIALAASMIGSFDSHLPNTAAQNAVKALIECGVSKGYIQHSYSLFGHRDINPTSCPGTAWYNHLRSVWPSHFHRSTAKYYSQGK